MWEVIYKIQDKFSYQTHLHTICASTKNSILVIQGLSRKQNEIKRKRSKLLLVIDKSIFAFSEQKLTGNIICNKKAPFLMQIYVSDGLKLV